MTKTINDFMTIVEAAERYNINPQTLKNKFKPSVVGQEKIDGWVSEGLIRLSSKTWILSTEFMEQISKN
ncbi:helix-turn-helix domain-containing protein [Metasolibacillus sp.]|uniref:helix-turn-helix domain-containing protein n=1 Tax=Metasolibacillus sp. TaxID=2703680 RepID=UPI0025F48F05|nr:helix-turn-helix domain-containing protein [Metasolibacillus sp.]MCT6925413.1 helix-turn-helix domain-containing protein [Metasolibacillus sp.]MCT6941560.1 helix-turn-helix domain-containing protein [Metasolibacillus sp.]